MQKQLNLYHIINPAPERPHSTTKMALQGDLLSDGEEWVTLPETDPKLAEVGETDDEIDSNITTVGETDDEDDVEDDDEYTPDFGSPQFGVEVKVTEDASCQNATRVEYALLTKGSPQLDSLLDEKLSSISDWMPIAPQLVEIEYEGVPLEAGGKVYHKNLSYVRFKDSLKGFKKDYVYVAGPVKDSVIRIVCFKTDHEFHVAQKKTMKLLQDAKQKRLAWHIPSVVYGVKFPVPIEGINVLPELETLDVHAKNTDIFARIQDISCRYPTVMAVIKLKEIELRSARAKRANVQDKQMSPKKKERAVKRPVVKQEDSTPKKLERPAKRLEFDDKPSPSQKRLKKTPSREKPALQSVRADTPQVKQQKAHAIIRAAKRHRPVQPVSPKVAPAQKTMPLEPVEIFRMTLGPGFSITFAEGNVAIFKKKI